jgi:hypothetical protein
VDKDDATDKWIMYDVPSSHITKLRGVPEKVTLNATYLNYVLEENYLEIINGEEPSLLRLVMLEYQSKGLRYGKNIKEYIGVFFTDLVEYHHVIGRHMVALSDEDRLIYNKDLKELRNLNNDQQLDIWYVRTI